MEKFTDRTRKALYFARKEAERYNHRYLGSEHILLGILKQGDGVGATVLEKLGVDLEKVRAGIGKRVEEEACSEKMGALPFTPQAKLILTEAEKYSAKLGDTYVGTEHLLYGVAAQEKGVGYEILNEDCGIDAKHIDEGIRWMLGVVDKDIKLYHFLESIGKDGAEKNLYVPARSLEEAVKKADSKAEEKKKEDEFYKVRPAGEEPVDNFGGLKIKEINTFEGTVTLELEDIVDKPLENRDE